MTRRTISAQVSLYPLRQTRLSPGISRMVDVLRASGLKVSPGSMSTVIAGEVDVVFDTLKASFESAAALGDVVMVASFSNCCPATADEPQSG